MVDILGIINELPSNPSEALIELDWRLSKMAHLFPKAHKKSDIVYHIPLSLDNKKSYLKPAFDSHTYIDYLKVNGKSRQKKPIPNYKPQGQRKKANRITSSKAIRTKGDPNYNKPKRR